MAITAFNLECPQLNRFQSVQLIWENSQYHVFHVKIPLLQDPIVSCLIQSELIRWQPFSAFFGAKSPRKKDRRGPKFVTKST